MSHEAKFKDGGTIRSTTGGHVVVVMDGEPDDEGWVRADTTDYAAIIHVSEDGTEERLDIEEEDR